MGSYLLTQPPTTLPHSQEPIMRSPSLLAHERHQLCEWISDEEEVEEEEGRVPEPLYKATVDGWSAAKFHELCNNKGSTVTVIYDQ